MVGHLGGPAGIRGKEISQAAEVAVDPGSGEVLSKQVRAVLVGRDLPDPGPSRVQYFLGPEVLHGHVFSTAVAVPGGHGDGRGGV